jgi:hypothetical protein
VITTPEDFFTVKDALTQAELEPGIRWAGIFQLISDSRVILQLCHHLIRNIRIGSSETSARTGTIYALHELALEEEKYRQQIAISALW